MGKFGTGCCTGGYKFAGNGGWKPPTGGGSNPPTGGATAPDESSCDPLAIPDFNDISFGTTGLDWPEWVKKHGCSLISILTLNEKTWDLTGILTPENVEELADCVADCLVRTGLRVELFPGIREGLSWEMIPCINECKEDFMADKYEISTDVSTLITTDTSSFKDFSGWDPSTVLSSLCPPLCVKQQVVISFQGMYKCWHINLNTGLPYRAWRSTHGHRVQCEIISCTPLGGLAMCFKCFDREPQIPGESIMCIDSGGGIVHRNRETRPDMGQPGSCKRKMKNPSYRGDYKVLAEKPGSAESELGSVAWTVGVCCEYEYHPMKMVTDITIDTPCPDGKDE